MHDGLLLGCIRQSRLFIGKNRNIFSRSSFSPLTVS